MAKPRKRKGSMKLADESVKFEMNVPVFDLKNFTFFFYGPPKIGKTMAAISWPDPMVFACETRGIAALNVANCKIRNWQQFRGAITKIQKKKYEGIYQTVIIDTVVLAFKYCLDWCCETYGFEHPSDQGWGKGWEKLSNEFLEQILRLFDTDLSIIFIAHSIDKDVKDEWGESMTKTEAFLPGPARKILLPIVDVIFYMTSMEKKKKRVRVLTTKTTPRYEAGDRTGCLTDKTIVIPRKQRRDAYSIVNGIFIKNAEKGD